MLKCCTRHKLFFTASRHYPCNLVSNLLDFDAFTHFEVNEFENHIFNGWSVCASDSVISITPKQIIAKTPNLVFYICIISRCYLKLYIKIGQKLCVQEHTKEF